MAALFRRCLADGHAHVGFTFGAPPLENTATLTFAASTPHAVIDAFFECEVEAGAEHRAVFADLSGTVDARTVTREECGRGMESAVAIGHPDSS